MMTSPLRPSKFIESLVCSVNFHWPIFIAATYPTEPAPEVCRSVLREICNSYGSNIPAALQTSSSGSASRLLARA